MLGTVSDGYYTVAVAGTHGKTTTTAMLAKVAIDAGLDPTVIVGSLLLSTSLGTSKSLESNLIVGNSNLFIVEACEYNRSFLDLKPNILVITNVDSDHLDYYKDLTDIQNAFTELANKLGEKDFLVCNPEDEKVAPAVKNVKCKIIDYSLGNLIPKLKVPGEYNQENAKAAFAIAEILKVEKEKTFSSLQEFEGVWRRFEYKGETQNGAEVYDDYAHHPTEIRAALRATHKKFPNRKIIVVFQPHLYSRTRLLLKDMADSFSDADEVLVAPIYAAREEEDLSINSSILAEEIEKNGKKAKSYKDFSEIEAYLRESAKKGNIIITMGAGDIYKIAENLIKS